MVHSAEWCDRCMQEAIPLAECEVRRMQRQRQQVGQALQLSDVQGLRHAGVPPPYPHASHDWRAKIQIVDIFGDSNKASKYTLSKWIHIEYAVQEKEAPLSQYLYPKARSFMTGLIVQFKIC